MNVFSVCGHRSEYDLLHGRLFLWDAGCQPPSAPACGPSGIAVQGRLHLLHQLLASRTEACGLPGLQEGRPSWTCGTSRSGSCSVSTNSVCPRGLWNSEKTNAFLGPRPVSLHSSPFPLRRFRHFFIFSIFLNVCFIVASITDTPASHRPSSSQPRPPQVFTQPAAPAAGSRQSRGRGSRCPRALASSEPCVWPLSVS